MGRRVPFAFPRNTRVPGRRRRKRLISISTRPGRRRKRREPVARKIRSIRALPSAFAAAREDRASEEQRTRRTRSDSRGCRDAKEVHQARRGSGPYRATSRNSGVIVFDSRAGRCCVPEAPYHSPVRCRIVRRLDGELIRARGSQNRRGSPRSRLRYKFSFLRKSWPRFALFPIVVAAFRRRTNACGRSFK